MARWKGVARVNDEGVYRFCNSVGRGFLFDMKVMIIYLRN